MAGLVGQIAQGNSGSLSDLHRLTCRPLLLVARTVLPAAMDAEEVVGDAFVYVWRHSGQYDSGRGSVIAWLTVIVRHRAIDLIRKSRSHYSLDDDFARPRVANIACAGKGPEQSAAHEQTRRQLHRALADLPFPRRQVVELAFFHHLTHAEISTKMGIPEGTVKSHIRRALCRMRVAIAEQA